MDLCRKLNLSHLALAIAGLAVAAPTQQLRLGVARADHVVLARQVGVQPLGADVVLHRFETVETWKGDAPQTFTIPVPKQVSDQPRPRPAQLQVCCLRTQRGAADLPERFAPYFGLTGYQGDHAAPTGDAEIASLRDVVRALVASEGGLRPSEVAGRLVQVVLNGRGSGRLEAAETLRGREVLAAAVSPLERDALQTLAVGETDDVPLKVSVASLVVELNGAPVLPTLLPALRTCHDPRWALAIGRLARFCHEGDADVAIAPFVRTLEGRARATGLLALGATRTDGALEQLLALREREGAGAAIDAALRAHGSKRALEVVGDSGEDREPPRERR